MDWGQAQGLQGLYQDVGKRQAARDELSVLNMLGQQMRQDKQDEEVAQLKEQAYYDQVAKFSDSLLAADRDKINNKAKILSKKVREHVRLYGGDMTKFFDNGGHKILGDYKRELINSEESSQYMDNKKNMDLIVKAQMSGHGHLLNQTDLHNLESYQKNKGGKITYTGLLNEVDMPDAGLYDYGTIIPSEDILYAKDNYAKIYGNYKTTYPNSGEPSEADLLAYVTNTYQQRGGNWQRNLAIEKEKNRHLESMARARKTTNKGGGKGKAKSSAKGGGDGYGPFSKNYTNLYTGQVTRLFSHLPQNMSVAEYKEGYWDNFKHKKQLNNVSSGDFKEFATHYSLQHDSAFDFSSDDIGRGDGVFSKIAKFGVDWLEEEYAPRNARRFFNGLEGKVAKSTLNLPDKNIDTANNKIIDVQPNGDWYDAMGNRLSDLQTELNYEGYKGDFDIKGIINIATVDTNNGGREMNSMVMNVIDGEDIDQEKTTELDEAYGASQMSHKNAIVVENSDGVRFYVPVDINQPTIATKLNEDLGSYNDLEPVVEDQYNRVREEDFATDFTAQQEQNVNDFWNLVEEDQNSLAPMYSELLHFSAGNGYDAVRDDLLKSYYGALAMHSNPNKTTPNDFSMFVGGNDFSKTIKQAENEHGIDYTSQIRDYKISDENIIMEMMGKDDNSQKPFYQLWLQNYNMLQRR